MKKFQCGVRGYDTSIDNLGWMCHIKNVKNEGDMGKDLCQKIEQIYPDIGQCGIDMNVSYDDDNERWKVHLKKDNKSLDTFLEPGDAELCMEGKQCVSLGIEIRQLKDNIRT